MKEITVQELAAKISNKEDFQLIDVRQPFEADICSIGAQLIPMGEIMDHIEEISKTKQVVIHCKSGARSGSVIQALEAKFEFNNLYNLKGGIFAWINEIDTSLSKY